MAKQQVRGKDLRSKMIESEREGEDYRKSHNGSDSIDTGVRHRNGHKPEKNKK